MPAPVVLAVSNTTAIDENYPTDISNVTNNFDFYLEVSVGKSRWRWRCIIPSPTSTEASVGFKLLRSAGTFVANITFHAVIYLINLGLLVKKYFFYELFENKSL